MRLSATLFKKIIIKIAAKRVKQIEDMKKRKYIKLLQECINDLDSSTFSQESWIESTNSIIKKVFNLSGKEKANIIHGLNYDFNLRPLDNSKTNDKQIENGKEKARQFLKQYIDEIKKNGVEKNNNLKVVLIKNWPLYSVIIALATISYTIGFHHGKSDFDAEKMELYELNKKNKIKIDSLNNIINSSIFEIKDSIKDTIH